MQDPYGRTPLHVAAASNSIESTLLLINQKVNLNVLDIFGHTPLDDARRQRHAAVISVLEASGALPGTDDSLKRSIRDVREWHAQQKARLLPAFFL